VGVGVLVAAGGLVCEFCTFDYGYVS
jgi:hypothetical protein